MKATTQASAQVNSQAGLQLSREDWKKLKTPLILLSVILIVVVLLVTGVQRYLTTQANALQAQQQILSTAKQRYLSSGAEKKLITEFLPQYQQLISKGFVGEERRIEWVEALRAQHKVHKLFGIKYAIEQQEDYKPNFAPSLGGFMLYRSIMKLDLDMLHEGDILQLTESLNSPKSTPFILRDCVIARVNNNGFSNQLVPNMHAECELDWLTIHEPEAIVGVNP